MKLQIVVVLGVLACAFAAPAADVDNADQSKPAVDPAKVDEDSNASVNPKDSTEAPQSSEDKQDSAEEAKSSDDKQDFEKALKSAENQKDSSEAPKSGEDQQDSAEGNQYRTLNDVQKGQEGLIHPADSHLGFLEWDSIYGTHDINAAIPVDEEFPDNWMELLQALHPGNPTLNDDDYLVPDF